MSDKPQPFECYGVVDLFGHVRVAGKLSEQTIAGTTYLRIDVPGTGNIPEHTRFFGGSAIYGITPTTEAVARQMVAGLQSKPIQNFELPVLRQQTLFDEADQGD